MSLRTENLVKSAVTELMTVTPGNHEPLWSLGQMLQICAYRPSVLRKALEYLAENENVFFGLYQPDDNAELIYDGELIFDREQRQFIYVGSEGPGGFGDTIQRVVNVNDRFMAC